MTEISAFIACTILLLLALFQLALMLGAPIGKYAWGGGHDILPTKFRVGSCISIILYAVFALVILNKAAVINLISNDKVLNLGIWALTAYFFIGVMMNGISR